MEFATFYGIFLICMLCSFVGMVIWTFYPKRKNNYEEAANLVFADDAQSPVEVTKS